MSMLPTNLGHLFDVPLKMQPDAPAVLQGDVVLSFRDLDERCNRVANALVDLGTRVGDRVALMFSNDYRFIESLLGTMRIGAVPVPLNIRMGDDALSYVVDDSEAVVLIANSDLSKRALALAPRWSRIGHVIIDADAGRRALNYDEWLAAASPSLNPRQTNFDDICLQPYTSGSTGKPKGVLLTHGGQIWNADVLRKLDVIDHTERAVVAVPLYHKNAMAGAVKPFLIAGGSLVILKGFDPVGVIEAIERYKGTYMTGVPAMYAMIFARKDVLATHDVSSLRYAACGSAEVSEELIAEFHRVFPGAIVVEGYGLTEGGPVPVAMSRYGLIKRGSCGREVPNCEVRIVGEDGITDVGPQRVGELITRNPGLAKGYWKLPDATKQRFRNGWLYTGDLMRRDEDGFFYFVGRKDDMINVSGENVYPKEIVDILLRHPDIREACVVSVSHPVKGSVPVAFVVRSGAGRLTAEDIKQFYLQHGAPYAYPRRVHFLDAMPLAGTGKVNRAELTKRAEDYEARGQDEAA
jgi:acyl-CoA synthetase (AMP-forming)/AMP-acid ligase II